MIKYILFDFFGVIMPDYLGHKPELEYREKALEIPMDTLKPVVIKYREDLNQGHISTQTFWDNISHDLGITIDKDPDMLFVDTINNRPVSHKMLNFIQDLRTRGYICAVLSDVFPADEAYLDKIGLYDVFDHKFLSCELGLSKREDKYNHTHKIFDYALDTLNAKPNEALFIDDRESNCETAKNAGIQTILATTVDETIQQIKKKLNIK